MNYNKQTNKQTNKQGKVFCSSSLAQRFSMSITITTINDNSHSIDNYEIVLIIH